MFRQKDRELLQAICKNIEQLQINQREIFKQMSSVNSTIQQVAADFKTAQTALSQYFADATKANTDATKFYGDFGTFADQVKAFIASVNAPGSETKLSQADQDTLNAMDAALAPLASQATALDTQTTALDAQASGLDQALAAITIPAPAVAPTA